MKVLVTGAAGKTGRAVLAALEGVDGSVRALVRRSEYCQRLPSAAQGDVVAGDMLDPSALAVASDGVDAVYHIAPNMHPEEERMGELALAAAREAGVRHFVYHSVLHPQLQAMPHHWRKLRVEARVMESGIPFTILQPASYMQNLQTEWSRVRRGAPYRVPYAAGTRLNWVDLRDVASAAARVLSEGGHEYASYELAGPSAPSQEGVAATMGELLGRQVGLEEVPLEQWAEDALRRGLDEGRTEAFLAMFRHYQAHHFLGNPSTLEWLLGRPPNDLRSFLADELGP